MFAGSVLDLAPFGTQLPEMAGQEIFGAAVSNEKESKRRVDTQRWFGSILVHGKKVTASPGVALRMTWLSRQRTADD
jgi:hypothetical protein